VAPTTGSALVAEQLTKSYSGGRGKPPVRALDGLGFEAAAGTVFGLLGPNGAGKSTTMKILSTLARADSGSAVVAGIDVARHPGRVRRVIGFVAQKPVSDPMATGVENLVLAGRLQGMRAAEAKARAAELLSGSASPSTPDGRSRPTPAVWRASWTSPSASCTGRRCSSSTSRPPGSIRRRGPSCGMSSTG
jgi:ABC-type sugar transport system ATPase subunit